VSGSAAQAPPRRPRRRIRKLRLLALVGVLWLLAATAFTFGLVAAVASEIPELNLTGTRTEANGIVYANDGRTVLVVLRGDENRVPIGGDEIAPIMKQAIVAIEDRRFWEHRGIDLRGIARALWADLRQKRVVEGGSTITQQFVKNTLLDDERTIGRKVREAALAWQLEERTENKGDILTAYLNTIYFGNGAYGVQQAARVYFGKGARSLELHEAALLAGIPADPSGFDPVAQPQRAEARRETVLRTMAELGDISRADYEQARREPLPRPEDVRLPAVQGKAPYFANYVNEQLIDRYGPRRVFGGGIRVQTTIDLTLQELAREAVAEWLPEPEDPEAALVALDPQTGNVLAMVGGRNYRTSQFNLATQGQRQPGSAFKPFVLAAALEHGVAPTTTMESRPVSIPLGDRQWTVGNYEDAYLGRIDLETATVHSDNAVYAQLARLLRPKRVVATARRAGISSPLDTYFSIALGAQAVNPLELARAYAAFASGGFRVDTETAGRPELGNRPRVIDAVLGPDGRVLDWNKPVRRQVLSGRTAAHVNRMLQATIERGTGRRAMLDDGRPAAGKTGTTENYGDAWFVGYTPNLVVAVWVGYPKELRPMLTEFEGEPVGGGTLPALIWKSFMEKAVDHLGLEPAGFEPPPPLAVDARLVVDRDGEVQLDNGVCHSPLEVSFFAGEAPDRTADCVPNEVEVPSVTGRRLAAARERLEAQPLTAVVVYRPAEPGEPAGVVVEQHPRRGRLSSFEKVTLVVARAEHGVVPDLRGLALDEARRRLSEHGLRSQVRRRVDGPPGEVVGQSPKPGIAAAQGQVVELDVGRP
jgi:penicillin-binding protein 1A